MSRQLSRRGLLASGLSTIVISCLTAGCQKSDASYLPAHGKLLVGNQPAEGALVTLVPAADPNDSGPRASGKVAADGTFRLQTYDPDTRVTHPGAKKGEYLVIVTWVDAPNGASLETGMKDRLGNRYRDPRRSNLKLTVTEGGAELPPIELPAVSGSS